MLAQGSQTGQGEIGDIFPALPQGRQFADYPPQAKKQIMPEFASLHHFFQISVGRSHQPKVAGFFPGAADGAEPLFLKNPEKVFLQRQWHLSNLVEKKGAFVRLLNQAAVGLDRAGKRAFLMTEKDALHQIGWQVGAIDDDEIPTGARTVFMNGSGKYLFAGSGFAGDQHRGVAVRRHSHDIETAVQGRAVADDLLSAQGPERSFCFFLAPVLERSG